MYSPILKVKLAFLAVFFVGCAGLWAYQIMYVWPGKRCEGTGGWWARQWKACGIPVDITTITGRPRGSPPLDNSAPRSAAPSSSGAPKAQPGDPASPVPKLR